MPKSDMKIRADVCVVGLGYIGLPTAVFFASALDNVVGVDLDSKRVSDVNKGVLPFVEPGLGSLLSSVVDNGTLRASTKPISAKNYIIAVPTPVDEDHSVDLHSVFSAVEAVLPLLQGDELVVLESTIPPGTTDKVAEYVFEQRPELRNLSQEPFSLEFAHCPERVLPGKIMEEMAVNDRVAGGLTPEAGSRARELYSLFCRGDIMVTDAKTAEMTKLTENTFRDINIAFANELSILCENQGINVWELIELANHHPRVNILKPGPGVGGHCIAVDPWFIVSSDPQNSRLIATARSVNDSKPHYVIDKILKVVSAIPEPKIAFLGISFKANVDDVRHSPAVSIVDEIAAQIPEATIQIVDPHVRTMPSQLAEHNNISLSAELKQESVSDVVVVLVDHSEFLNIDPRNFGSATIVDTRGIHRFWPDPK